MLDLYREQLMEHYKSPRNRGSMKGFSVEAVEQNPLCGDVVKFQLLIKDGEIADVKFDGNACAVSIAASSMLTEAIKHKTVDEVLKISKENVLDLVGIELTTSRVKCAILALTALKNAIKKYETTKRR